MKRGLVQDHRGLVQDHFPRRKRLQQLDTTHPRPAPAIDHARKRLRRISGATNASFNDDELQRLRDATQKQKEALDQLARENGLLKQEVCVQEQKQQRFGQAAAQHIRGLEMQLEQLRVQLQLQQMQPHGSVIAQWEESH
jgi:hypothetical protein